MRPFESECLGIPLPSTDELYAETLNSKPETVVIVGSAFSMATKNMEA